MPYEQAINKLTVKGHEVIRKIITRSKEIRFVETLLIMNTCLSKSKWNLDKEVYSGPGQTSKMESFEEIVNGF